MNDGAVLNGEGSIAFTKPDRTTTRIFLRQGSIYAVDNLEYENRLWSQLRFEKHITHSNLRALIRAHKSQRESLYKLLRKARNKLKNDENLVLTLQEYALGAIDDIYSWEDVSIEWRMGDTFLYDAANIPEFPLSHLLTLCANRSLFKYKKYDEWGFKNDDQFLYGNVLIGNNDNGSVKSESALEEAILLSQKFVIKGLIENTGYSIFTVTSALDDLAKRISVTVENPSGRQKPAQVPNIPHDVPVVKDKAYFSATDEDPDMLKVFNTEYHVPEPALLDDNEETFNNTHKISKPENDEFNSFNDVINNTSAIEIIEADLPPLKRETFDAKGQSRIPIPKEDLEKEEKANDIESLYKSLVKEVPKARGAVKKPVKQDNGNNKSTPPVEDKNTTSTSETIAKNTETQTENPQTENPEGHEMPSDLQLLDLLEQVKARLAARKNEMEELNHSIREKEVRLDAANREVNRLTAELSQDIDARNVAQNEYEKAVQIINSLKN